MDHLEHSVDDTRQPWLRRPRLGTASSWTLHFMTNYPNPHATLPGHTVTHSAYTTPRSLSSYSHDHGPTCRHRPAVTSASHDGADRQPGPLASRAPLGPERRLSLPVADPRLDLSQPLDERHPIAARRTDFRVDPDHLISSAVGVHMELLFQASPVPTFHQGDRDTQARSRPSG